MELNSSNTCFGKFLAILFVICTSLSLFSQNTPCRDILSCSHQLIQQIEDPVERSNELQYLGTLYAEKKDTETVIKIYREIDLIGKNQTDTLVSAAIRIRALRLFYEYLAPSEVMMQLRQIVPTIINYNSIFHTEEKACFLDTVSILYTEIEEYGLANQIIEKISYSGPFTSDKRCAAMYNVMAVMHYNLIHDSDKVKAFREFKKCLAVLKPYEYYPEYTTYSIGKINCIDTKKQLGYACLKMGMLHQASQLIGMAEESSDYYLLETFEDLLKNNPVDSVIPFISGFNTLGYKANAYFLCIDTIIPFDTAMVYTVSDMLDSVRYGNDIYDNYKINEMKYELVQKLLILDDYNTALKQAKSITEDHIRSKALIKIAEHHFSLNRPEQAITIADDAFIDMHRARERSEFLIYGYVRLAKLYSAMSEENKFNSTMEEAIASSKKDIRSDYFIEVSLEHVAIAFAELHLYNKAAEIASSLSNGGSGSKRSSCEEKIYKAAFSNGDTLEGKKLLMNACAELKNIEHEYQQLWYVREASIQYAYLKDYTSAVAVASTMQGYAIGYLEEALEGFLAASKKNGDDPVSIVYLKNFLDLGTKYGGDNSYLLKMVIDAYCTDGQVKDQDLENQIKLLCCKGVGAGECYHWQTLFYFYYKGGNKEEMKNILTLRLKSIQKIEKPVDQNKRLRELYQFYQKYKMEPGPDEMKIIQDISE